MTPSNVVIKHNKIVKTPNIARKLRCLPGRLFCFSALF
ncbi:hypothetical protein VCRA2123O444_310027 [Vibrio crassostreae]|nr:hypothetical protein VCRA2117O428_290033 [Vibrio crassostreae]CAK2009305.1 hypothetical protein VCRA2113O416_300034 [Vibrio crassostreae]CAK2018018.1 hypothetical protein VCRA2119O431_300033 [Vibrio crassostreae]CAK2836011.1 hypothetical protein VCRA2126O448_280033 [Vibrio crassostreae]CAK2880399.1 hypothetical protein VCRA2133O452_290033 [Vibrio crassostreae]